jgi:uncharacterized protein
MTRRTSVSSITTFVLDMWKSYTSIHQQVYCDVYSEAVKGRTSSFGSRLAQIRRLRIPLEEAAQKHGVRDLRVFGSVARGDDAFKSDVDLLVEIEPARTLLDLIGFQQDAEDILGIRVRAAAPRLLKPRIRTRAIREARPL